MKIIEEPKQNSIPVSEMKDGELAVITDWDDYGGDMTHYIGRIVQRYGNALISVGMPLGYGWRSFFENIKGHLHEGRVRILPQGTKLEI